ncbi:MAG: hypothetical protein ABS76_24465 [Pelagibacterium sp. SCN 64-44]|nr:MAG: hypothetical protein ABS76_24465 [Pelagibacterium sp. SCN 64-44]
MSFELRGEIPEASCCHCTRCRKATGHYEAGIDVDKSNLVIEGQANVTWYFSSETVRRGFCSTCGSPLFFDPPGADWIGLHLGSFDGPTGAKIARHIFVADKGDYYDICDGAPQYETVPGAVGDAAGARGFRMRCGVSPPPPAPALKGEGGESRSVWDTRLLDRRRLSVGCTGPHPQ